MILPLPDTWCFSSAIMRLNAHSIWHVNLARGASSQVSSAHVRVHRTICNYARRTLAFPRASTTVPRVELRRSAKTQATVKVKDLPQGVVKLEAYDDRADDTPQYPTVVQGHRNNMQQFKNCVILTRVGGFYEVRLYLHPTGALGSCQYPVVFRASGGIRPFAQLEACV